MATLRQVADYFISLADLNSGDLMTHLRLQKLVYYSQAWSLALRNKPMFEHNIFQAWPHGPVSPALWNQFKGYGFNPIPVTAATTSPNALNSDDKAFLDEVWRVYGNYSAKRLEEITHSESPWIDARAGLAPIAKSDAEITQSAMKSFYKSKLVKKK